MRRSGASDLSAILYAILLIVGVSLTLQAIQARYGTVEDMINSVTQAIQEKISASSH